MGEKGEEEALAAYNEGIYQIQRLNELWNRCNLHSRQGRLNDWRWDLEIIWRELSRDAMRLPRTDSEISYVLENDNLNKALSVAFKLQKPNLIYKLLGEKEVFLRSLQDAAGKGAKYADTDLDHMD